MIVAVVGVVAAVAVAVVSYRDRGSSSEPVAVKPVRKGLWVDGDSAVCSDSRPAGAVNSLRPWCTLERAARAAPGGAVVRVVAADYGDRRFSGIDRRPAVTLRAAPGPRPRLGYTVFDGASGIRLVGFRFTDPVDIYPGDNGRIGIFNGVFARFRNVGVNVGPGAHDVTVRGNLFKDLWEEGQGIPGKGVNANGYGPEISRLRIVGNKFARTRGGGIAVAGVRDSLIEANEIAAVAPAPGSPIHADPILIQGATRLTVSRNLIRENEQAIVIFDGVSGLRFVNNTVVGGENYGVNFQGSAPGLRFLANTIWDNAFGGLLVQGTLGPGALVVNNILQSVSGGGGIAGVEDYNLIGRGPRNGRHDRRGAPRFTAPPRLDYSLRRRSRAIDAGTSDGTPRRDRLGHGRVDDPEVRNRGGGRRPYFDLGAQERIPKR